MNSSNTEVQPHNWIWQYDLAGISKTPYLTGLFNTTTTTTKTKENRLNCPTRNIKRRQNTACNKHKTYTLFYYSLLHDILFRATSLMVFLLWAWYLYFNFLDYELDISITTFRFNSPHNKQLDIVIFHFPCFCLFNRRPQHYT